ncbi:solute carrier family 22 member 2-like [Zophobas morio]|uniref:solute carrier family 22 member 2-like n=1 Tax=Zophobas morio TaxID=2755281 RepID=UPI003083B1A4
MRRVNFELGEPSEKEYFEEYDKYATVYSWWFCLILILRCCIPFCLALQVGPYEYSDSIKVYRRAFLNKQNHQNITQIQVVGGEYNVQKSIILQMIIFKSAGFGVGAVLIGVFADVYGRSVTSFLASMLWATTAAISVLFQHATLIQVWYSVITACASATCVVTFVSFAEIINKKQRVLVVYTCLGYVVGDILLTYIVDNLQTWKYTITFAATASTCAIFATWYIPESPRWLFNKNKKRQVYDQLNEISGLKYEITLANAPPEGDSHLRICYDMFRYITREKLKHIIICNICIGAAGANFSTARLKVTLYYNNADEFKHIANVAEVLAYLLLIPMLIFLGKRNSLFACFCLLSTSAMIGIILPENTQIFYNIFAVLLGQTGLCFCWFLFLDLFPTFSRATVMGIGICTYNIASAITIVTVNLIDEFSYFNYCIMFFLISLLGMSVLSLSDYSSQDLLNFKLYR